MGGNRPATPLRRSRASDPSGQALRGFKSGCLRGPLTPPDPGWLLAPGVLSDPWPLQSAALQIRVLSRPVLKHGPRSLTCARVTGIKTKPRGAVKALGLASTVIYCRLRARPREDDLSYQTGAAGQHSRGASASAA